MSHINSDIVIKALVSWRRKRDEEFEKAGLILEDVYREGNFLKLPPSCLMAICYVDAYSGLILRREENEKI